MFRERSENLERSHTRVIDGALLTCFQRPLDQFQSLIHVVSSTHSITGLPSRLFQQPHDVCWIRGIPLHTVNAPVMCGECLHS